MTTASVIGPATVIRGGVRGDGDLEIQGRVEGSVVVNGEVVVAESALVKSDIRARRVIVRGAVRGNVSADELLVLEPGAKVLGDLGAPQVGIRPGGLVKGHVSTSGPLPLEKPKPAVAAKAAPAPVRAATPPARAVTPPARPAPPPARPAPAPASRPSNTASSHAEHEVPAPRATPVRAPAAVAAPPPVEPEIEPEVETPAEPPPPIVPALPKGARAPAKKRGAAK